MEKFMELEKCSMVIHVWFKGFMVMLVLRVLFHIFRLSNSSYVIYNILEHFLMRAFLPYFVVSPTSRKKQYQQIPRQEESILTSLAITIMPK